MTTEETIVYECGNWGTEGECPRCGANECEEQPSPYSTVVITCDGWYEGDSE